MTQNKTIANLVIVSPSFPKNEENDIVVPPLNLYLRELKSLYPTIKISVIAIHFPFHKNPYQVWGIDVYPCGGRNGNIAIRPLVWSKAKKYLKQIHHQTPIDAIQSFWLNESPLIVRKFCSKFNVTHLCTLMGQDATATNKYLRFFRKSHPTLVCLSDFQKTVLEQNTSLKVSQVIPWGIVAKEFHADQNIKRPIDLLCVSSLIPLKRVNLFIDLVYRLKAKGHKNIKATIIGGGKLHNELTSKIISLQLEENIQLLGLKPRQEVLLYMKKSKVLVHTSSYEAQGYVLNEALTAGCYVQTLSRGLMMDNPRFEILLEKDLTDSVERILNQEDKDFSANTPIRMLDTIEMYNQLLKEKGVHF